MRMVRIGLAIATLLLAATMFAGPGWSARPPLAAGDPPLNDDFAQAKSISALPYSDSTRALEATAAPDDPRLSCFGSTLQHTVWYAFRPAAAVRVRITSLSFFVGRAVAVLTGARGALSEVGCDPGQHPMGLLLRLQPGTTYYVLVGAREVAPGPNAEFALHLAVEPPDKRSSLDVELSKSAARHGERVSVTAHLGEFASVPNRTVTVYATPYHEPERIIGTGEVSASTGDFTVRYPATKRTRFFARWQGTDEYEPAWSDEVVLTVQVHVTTRLRGYRGTSGGAKLYRRGDVLIQTGSVHPRHPGKGLRFDAQVRRDGRWTRYAQAFFRMNRSGSTTAYLPLVRAGTYRVRNVFPGDADHAATEGRWLLIRVRP
jgi:hypothetical protein